MLMRSDKTDLARVEASDSATVASCFREDTACRAYSCIIIPLLLSLYFTLYQIMQLTCLWFSYTRALVRWSWLLKKTMTSSQVRRVSEDIIRFFGH